MLRSISFLAYLSLGLAAAASVHGAEAPSAAPAAATSAPTAAASLTFTPCQLPHPQGVLSIDAECATLSVPEDYATPGGRRIELRVARAPALSRRKLADPLVVLAGGPGLAATTFYTAIAPQLARIRRDRDVLLLDQRGTGASAPLNCPFEEQQMWSESVEDTARETAACLAKLQQERDVAQYTTSVAVRDLEQLRLALQVPRLNFYASSYGTRVAQHYARRHPAQTRALILDGVVPPPLVLGPAMPLDAQAAVDRILQRCTEDEHCRARFGDPAADLAQLRAKLAEAPVPLTLPHPRTAEPLQVEVSPLVLAGALRLASYQAGSAALLPLILKLANRDARYGPLATQFLLNVDSYTQVLAFGMHNSVVCSEDVPLYEGMSIDRERLAATFLGTTQLDALVALCKDWPRGPVDEDLHAPLQSEVPALLLSGTADPVTPAAYGDEAAKGFTHAVHLKVPDAGHGQVVQPCVDRVMADFLERAAQPASIAQLDGRCLTGLAPPPFFLTPNGPAP